MPMNESVGSFPAKIICWRDAILKTLRASRKYLSFNDVGFDSLHVYESDQVKAFLYDEQVIGSIIALEDPSSTNDGRASLSSVDSTNVVLSWDTGVTGGVDCLIFLEVWG